MSKSDVEMEDAEKLSNDSGNNIQESESKVTDAEVEKEGEKLHYAAAVAGDENKMEDGGEDINKCRNEDKDETDIKTEVKDQTDTKSEANDPMIAEGSVCEQINAKSENVELINTRTEDEEQTAARSAVEEQTDAKNEAVEQNATNVGLKEEKSTDNGMVGEDYVKKVEENPNEHDAEEKPKEIGKDVDYVEHDLGVQKTMESTDAVYDPRENRQLQTELSANDDGKTMENTDSVNDPRERSQLPTGVSANDDGKTMENTDAVNDPRENRQLQIELSANDDGKIMENTDAVNDPRENKQLQTGLSANDDGKTMENTDVVNDPRENKQLQAGLSANDDGKTMENIDAVNDPREKTMENIDAVNDPRENKQLQTRLSANDDEKTMEITHAVNDPREKKQLQTGLSANEAPQRQNAELDEVVQGEDEEMEDAATLEEDKTVKQDPKEMGERTGLASREADGNCETVETAAKTDGELANQHEAATPQSLVRYSPTKAGDHSGETVKSVFTQATLPLTGEDDDGTPEDQAAFMKELESFYKQKAMDFKPPKFYGQPLNCLKLWRAVIRLGGYDRVTGSKLWRQVGESFHPPKTCTTVSWTFRIFYEKSLLEFERHKTQSGELQLPVATLPEASGVDGEANCYQGSGSGRARRDAAARAMQGWHAQRLFGNGEVGEPIVKDKNLNNTAKREKNLKSIGSLKQKRPNEVDHSNKAARTETSKQLVASVVDVGPPADWVKINVRQTKDCFEVYALVPGLLREEVRVQSDPAGRVVITGQPEQVDNPWGITAFKKVVNLPARIDPLQTSAVVSLHGRLFVRVPLEQSNI
ncbi:AT-rich interactive domain-containing protein 5 [Sesamum alatum]|uniref:AT-rich interactive domain-containing protein 5 n=2 Tax=Sesamum TaxID=4181 RepID=A0AAE2CGZ8_9LAMI|nr:AT-rich interactive domain-containing protein 5 [Sesamum alatum]